MGRAPSLATLPLTSMVSTAATSTHGVVSGSVVSIELIEQSRIDVGKGEEDKAMPPEKRGERTNVLLFGGAAVASSTIFNDVVVASRDVRTASSSIRLVVVVVVVVVVHFWKRLTTIRVFDGSDGSMVGCVVVAMASVARRRKRRGEEAGCGVIFIGGGVMKMEDGRIFN